MRALSRASIVMFGLLCALALPAPGGESARPKAEIKASLERGFARIQFDWPDAVAGKAELFDGVLVISFNRPFDADTDTVAQALEPYVALVRADPDGRTLRLALKGPVRLKTTDYGTRFAFDLLPPSFTGDTVPPPRRDPRAPDPNRPMIIRVSERERTTRLYFDWPIKVDYSAQMQKGKLTVRFSKDSEVDLKRFSESPPGWVRGARASVDDGKLTLEFEVDPEADFRDVSEGNRIELELLEPKSDATAIEGASMPSRPPAQLVRDAASAERDPPPPSLVAAAIPFSMPPRKGEEAPPPAAQAEGHAPSGDAAAVQAAAEPEREAAAAQTPAPEALPPPLRPGQTDLQAALLPLPSATPPVPGKARAEIFGSLLRLELPYSKLPAAAVFRRGLAIWVVTATSELVDLSALSRLPNAQARVLSMPSEVLPGITAFRLEASASMSVSAAAAGSSWVLVIGSTVPDVPAQLQLVRESRGKSARLRALMPGVTRVVWIRDPQTQDRIACVLGYAPARGLADARRFAEFTALPSQQGLAVQAMADDLTVSLVGDEAVIWRPGGLNVSNPQLAQAPTPWLPESIRAESPAFADFAAWSKPVAATRTEAVRRLMRLSSTGPGGMSAPRMTLARFYLAGGFGAEALGVLRNIAREDRTAEASAPFRVARAIANIQMARYREAIADLSMDVLGTDPHAAVWRGIAAAGAREWRLARSNLMGALKIVSRYPPAWEGRARVALAQAALALGEPATATQALSGMPRAGLPVDVVADATMARAAIELAANKSDAALELYAKVTNSAHRPAAMRATLEATLLKLRLDKIRPDEAIDRLERLRFQWRGDEVELRTLTELGKLYVAQSRVREGLNAMRLAVRHFSDTDEARSTAAEMARIFEDLFLGGKANDVAPVQALAMFYDFRELTPVGARGDEMIRKLAERLIAVDLLPQAAELLQYQVDNRLDGIAKASVASRLALVYLLDRRPEKALGAIRATKQTRLPDELIVQRNLIESRALADLKMYDEALDLVMTDFSGEAERLRADILWDAQRWADAGAKTEELLGARYEDEPPLTDAERMDVMRASVAYSLAGDIGALDRMRTRFGPKMAKSVDAKAFAVVTQSPDVTGVDYKNLVKQVAAVDTLEAFLADFHARYGSGGTAPATN